MTKISGEYTLICSRTDVMLRGLTFMTLRGANDCFMV
jgi:hypothetical protein